MAMPATGPHGLSLVWPVGEMLWWAAVSPVARRIGEMARDWSAEGARVGFFSEPREYGGSEAYLRDVLRSAQERGISTMLFCPQSHPLLRAGAVPQECQVILSRRGDGRAGTPATPSAAGMAAASKRAAPAGRAMHRLVPRMAWLAAGTVQEMWRSRDLFAGRQLLLLHCNDSGCEAAPLGARMAGVPLVVGTLHALPGYDRRAMSLPNRLLELASMRCLDVAIAVSEYTKRSWVRRTHVNPERIRVIHNGIDVKAFSPRRPAETVRAEMGVPAGCPVVGMTARLHPMKGHVYLLRAIPEVIRAVPDVQVLLAGDGELRQPLAQAVERAGLAGRVHFLGYRTDVADVTQLYDVALLPSVSLECLPYTLMEAMALCKPVVASRFSGIPEMVADGVTGTLVPRKDPKALAGAIVDLLRNPDKARAFGEAGRRRVEEKFTQKRMLDETFALYEELLEKARGRRTSGGRVRGRATGKGN